MAAHTDQLVITTVISSQITDTQVGAVAELRDLGPTWGSWKTWRSCSTDNVICHDLGQARSLCRRAMQAVCNFYIPQKFFQALSRPSGVHLYQGDFTEDVLDLEDIVAMHLVAGSSSLVLMLGFDLTNPAEIKSDFSARQMKNRFGLIRQCILDHPETQWVLVDHDDEWHSRFDELPNLTRDTLPNVLQLLT